MQNIDRSKKKLINNILATGMYQILIMIVPIITTPFVTRIFSPAQIGEYGLSLAIANLFVILANAGMPFYGSREIAQSQDSYELYSRFNNLWSAQIINTVFWTLFYSLYVYYFSDMNPIFVCQILLVLVSTLDISWFYIGIEGIKNNIYRNLISKIFVTATIFVVVKNEDDLILYTLLNVLGMLLGNLSMFVGLGKLVKIKICIPNNLAHLIRKSYHLMYTQLIASIQGPAERGILNYFSKTTLNVGIYDQGIKIINLMFSVLNSAINAMMPRMAFEMSEGNLETVKRYSHKVMDLGFAFSILAISGIFNASDSFVIFFFGSGYEEVATVMKITSISLLFTPLSSFLSSGILIPQKKDNIVLLSAILITGTTIALNVLLDFKYTIYGISISYVASSVLGFIYRYINTDQIINPNKMLSKMVLSASLIILNIQSVNIFRGFITLQDGVFSFFVFSFITVGLNGLFLVASFFIKRIFIKVK